MKHKILIVEDDEISVRMLSMMLMDDFDIRVAEDGVECLKIIGEYHPDLILLDINMPKLDGDDVCYNIKRTSNTQHIPIIFVSSMAREEYVMSFGEMSAEDFIQKPIDEVVLREAINRVLSLSSRDFTSLLQNTPATMQVRR